MNVRNYNQWSWAFGAGIYLNSITFDGATTSFARDLDAGRRTPPPTSRWPTTLRRVTTYPSADPQHQTGFVVRRQRHHRHKQPEQLPLGVRERGQRDPVHPDVHPPEDHGRRLRRRRACPTRRTAARPRRRSPRCSNPRGRPSRWAVTDINVGTSAPNIYFYVKTFAQIGNIIYVGGKFRQVQHGRAAPTYTQSYLAAFDKTTGEWIPTFNPVINGPVWKVEGVARRHQAVRRRRVHQRQRRGQHHRPRGRSTPPPVRPLQQLDSVHLLAERQQRRPGDGHPGRRGSTSAAASPASPAAPTRLRRPAQRQPARPGRPERRPPRLEVDPERQQRGLGPQRQSQDLDRVYAVGTFTTLNGVALITPTKSAIVDTTTGAP